jgi:hypothetical protein
VLKREQRSDNADRTEVEDAGSHQRESSRSCFVERASRIADVIRNQFRQVAKYVAQRLPVPVAVSNRRGTGETDRAFAPARIQIMRRRPRVKPSPAASPFWDALNWLHLWEFNDSYSLQEFNAGATAQHLSLDL